MSAEYPSAAPSHTIKAVEATPDELRRMPSPWAEVAGGWGCLVLICGGAAFMLWKFGGWVGSWIGPTAETIGQWGGVLAGLALFVAAAIPVARYGRSRSAATRGSVDAKLVEEVAVTCSRAVAVEGDHSSITPGVCVEIGGGKLMLLLGQWLEDPDVLGVPSGTRLRATDDDERYLNRLPPPWSFPASKFTLRRVAATGDVLSLRVEGPYLEPHGEAVSLEASAFELLPQSAVLRGDLSDFDGALKRAVPKIVRADR